jgi:hypothetical protein
VFKQPLLGCISFLRSIVFELGSVAGGLTEKFSCYQRVLELCQVSESTLINLAESCVVWARQSFTPSSEIRLDRTPLSPASGKCFSLSLAPLSVGGDPPRVRKPTVPPRSWLPVGQCVGDLSTN